MRKRQILKAISMMYSTQSRLNRPRMHILWAALSFDANHTICRQKQPNYVIISHNTHDVASHSVMATFLLSDYQIGFSFVQYFFRHSFVQYNNNFLNYLLKFKKKSIISNKNLLFVTSLTLFGTCIINLLL